MASKKKAVVEIPEDVVMTREEVAALGVDVDAAEAEAEVATGIEAVIVPSKGSVTVTYPGGSRVYSKEVHGTDYKALAAEFAEKKKGKVA